MELPKSIEIVEVGARDGFQNIKEWIETDTKLKVIEGLVNAKFKKMEVTSFVHPKAIPQMKDAKTLAKTVVEKYQDQVAFNALVPNLYGAKAAWESGIREITYVISASEAHNKANVNRTHEESLIDLKQLKKELPDMHVKLDLATVFGCPFEGEVPVEQVCGLIQASIDYGVEEVCLCDTIGVANPKQIEEVLTAITSQFPEKEFSLHLHDTRGMGLANVLVGIKCGIQTFETAVAGLGGCPFAPGAAGNIASEDLVNMLESMGIETGLDLGILQDTVDIVRNEVKDQLTSHMAYVDRVCKA